MKYHTNCKLYQTVAGSMAEQALYAVASYLASLANSIQWGDCRLPGFDEFCKSVEARYTADYSGSYTFCFAIRDWFYANGGLLFTPSHSPGSWNVGPVDVWESNRQRSLKQWYRWLVDRKAPIKQLYFPDVLRDVGLQWLVTRGDVCGTFPKRVAKILNRCGIKLSPSHVETIGTIAREYVDDRSEVYFTFDRDYLNGRDVDYCNSGSCWWGSYSGGRYALYENGGYAIREWNSIDATGKPIARAWIVPVDGGHLIFNAYRRSAMSFARILADANGLSYRAVDIDVEDDGVYVNGNSGVFIAPVDVIERHSGAVYLDWQCESVESCEACGCSIDPECCPYAEGYGHYCEDCYSETFGCCDGCGTDYRYDDGEYVSTDSGAFCSADCARDADYDRCRDCGDWTREYQLTGDEEPVCDGCNWEYNWCDCDHLTDGEPVELANGDICCDVCADALRTCAGCEKPATDIVIDRCSACTFNPVEPPRNVDSLPGQLTLY